MAEEDRRYSDSEFALILRRAFELQERRAGELADGLTLKEIQAVAAEMGLDAAAVERAAASMVSAEESIGARVMGGPSLYQMEYTADGEISREGLTRVVDAVRRATGHQGKVTEVLGALEWETAGETSQIHVTVTPRDGQTNLRVMANRSGTGVLLYMLPGVVGFISIGIVGAITEPTSFGAIASLVTGCLGGAFLTGRTWFKVTGRRFQSKLRELMSSTTKAMDETLKLEKGRE